MNQPRNPCTSLVMSSDTRCNTTNIYTQTPLLPPVIGIILRAACVTDDSRTLRTKCVEPFSGEEVRGT